MKKSCFATLDNDVILRCVHGVAPVLFILAASFIWNQSRAEDYPLRVVYADVPGTELIEAGQIEAGIELLKAQLESVDEADSGDLWATLCAVYVIRREYGDAKGPCNKAVEIEPTNAALNNRGVYRAFTGDFAGAQADFNRARPEQLEAYIEQLTMRDSRVVAAGNHELIQQFLSKRNEKKADTSVAKSPATIEDLDLLVSR